MFYLVPSRHTQPGESGGENQEPSQHQEMAGGETRHALLEKRPLYVFHKQVSNSQIKPQK